MGEEQLLQTLRESEERYRLVVEQSPFSTVVFEPDGRVRSYNQAALALWRVGPEQLAFILDSYNVLEDEQWEKRGLRPYFLRGFAGEKCVMPPSEYTYRSTNADGKTEISRLWTVGHIYPVKNAAGVVQEVVIIHEDITAQKLAEQEREGRLQETRRRATELATVLESVRLASSSLELEEVLRRVARQLTEATGADACTLSQWNREKDAVITWIDYHRPGMTTPEPPGIVYQLADYPATRRVLETGRPLVTRANDPAADPAEVALLRHYGIELVLMVPIMHGETALGLVELERSSQPDPFTPEEIALCQALIGHMAVAIENARLVTAMQAQAAQMSLVLRSVDDGIILLDDALRVLLANPAGQRYLEDLADMDESGIVRALGERPLETLLERPLDGGARHEIVLPEHNRTYEVRASYLVGGAQAGACLLSISDVTQQREGQRLRQAQERLATVGQLAAGVAHDFNNLLAVISLYSELIHRTAELSPRNQAKLSAIRSQAGKAAELTGQILDFSRRSVMERGPLTPVPFVKEVVALLERTWPESIGLTFNYEGNLGMIMADPARLQQVLVNVAMNAREAMPAGGTLQISMRRVTFASGATPPLAGMAAGPWLAIGVADSGRGIPPEQLSHIFEPFFTTKTAGDSSGLGLAQAYGIVQQHEGHIDVSSRPGAGTLVTIYLPLLPKTATVVDTAAPVTIAPGSGETILVVEDNEATLEAVSDALEASGYQVLTAVDGVDGLQLYEERADEIALILSDLVMPRMGGAQLVERLKANNAPVKVVVMTGYPLEKEGRTLLEKGVVDWLAKPFSTEKLADVVQRALHGEKGRTLN